jgi:uncharacterized repeat protein (TIGR01451 family)
MINNKKQTGNSTMTKNWALCLLIFLGLLSTGVSAKQGHIKLTSKVQKLVIVNNNGKKVPTYVPASKVIPGETIQYTTYFENISGKAANGIKIVNPIPAHTVYLQNSAQGQGTVITFSVDGGKYYAKPAALKVRGQDGKLHPAKPSDYTHIRWQYQGNLAPKAKKLVAFKARLL